MLPLTPESLPQCVEPPRVRAAGRPGPRAPVGPSGVEPLPGAYQAPVLPLNYRPSTAGPAKRRGPASFPRGRRRASPRSRARSGPCVRVGGSSGGRGPSRRARPGRGPPGPSPRVASPVEGPPSPASPSSLPPGSRPAARRPAVATERLIDARARTDVRAIFPTGRGGRDGPLASPRPPQRARGAIRTPGWAEYEPGLGRYAAPVAGRRAVPAP